MKKKAHFKNLIGTFFIYCSIFIFCAGNMCRVLAAGDGKNKYSSSDREINVHNTAKNSKPCQPVTYTLSNPMEKSFSSSMERNDSLYDHNHRNSLSGILKYVFCITLSDD